MNRVTPEQRFLLLRALRPLSFKQVTRIIANFYCAMHTLIYNTHPQRRHTEGTLEIVSALVELVQSIWRRIHPLQNRFCLRAYNI